jgi:LacI family transcriptional regulator
MPIILEDIARMAGVSRSTVSRVINGDTHVSNRTQHKVQENIHRTNFQPNMAARDLAAGHTHILGLVVPLGVNAIFADPYFPLVIQGTLSACNGLGYSVMLWLAAEHEGATIDRILHNGLIAGAIVSLMLMDSPLLTYPAKSNRPFITIGRHPTDETINYIDADNRAGAYQGVSYLLRTGHRRVAVINRPSHAIAGWDRYHGYQCALRPELVAEGDYSDISGYLALQRLLPQQPDAVFAASDAMALAAIRAIQEAGRCVPEDIAVLSFDDIPAAATSRPPLTTIRQSILRTRRLTAETLIDLIAHPDPQPRRIVLPTELVIRASC